MVATMRLDAGSLLNQLKELSEIGPGPSGGRTRLALSDADKAAGDKLVSRMRESDLEVRVDRVGNIFCWPENGLPRLCSWGPASTR